MTLVAAPRAPRRRGGTAVTWLLARVGGLIIVLWAAATLTFIALRLIPGDPAEAVLGGPGSQASEEALAAARAEYGLDQPVLVQYLMTLARYVRLDFGTSYALRQDVTSVIAEQLTNTLVLACLSLALAWILALAVAVWSAQSGRIASALGSALEVVAVALPHFWLATSLVLLFSTTLGWLPPLSGRTAAGLVLPVITLAIPLAGFLGQVMRESLLNALSSPFALAAQMRGETASGVVWRHALRHAALPAIGLSGWAFGSLISGAVVVETVFARPGLGRTLLSAVQSRDIPLVSGIVLVVALAYSLVTVATDILERLADPRLAQEATV
ncbi:MAG TPA: ABC transporter permease [Glaciihabitans sp.]|nr:ABC transporter permease [Glaciihabitans sp.]